MFQINELSLDLITFSYLVLVTMAWPSQIKSVIIFVRSSYILFDRLYKHISLYPKVDIRNLFTTVILPVGLGYAFAKLVLTALLFWSGPLCLSILAITFEYLDIETSILVWWYILTISRSRLSIRIIPIEFAFLSLTSHHYLLSLPISIS